MPKCSVTWFCLDFPEGAAPGAVAGSPPCAAMPFYFGGRPVRGVEGIVSARAAGSMHYAPGGDNAARETFFRLLGAAKHFDAALVFSFKQIHSRTVLPVDRSSGPSPANPPAEADGMITADAAVTLAVTAADCLPVFLYDTVTGARALLHSGWKGTGIAVSALRLMAERCGTKAENVAALFGPCIQGRSYGVDEERARAFDAEFGRGGSFVKTAMDIAAGADPGEFPLGPPVFRRPDGSPAIAIQAANAHILAAAGIRDFSVCRNDTFTDLRLGSFRREGADHYTRAAAVFPPGSRFSLLPGDQS